MAAYAATVASPMRKPEPIGNSLGLYRGTVDLTNYNSTHAEITGITGKFRDPTTITVITSAESSLGYRTSWNAATKALKAWRSLTAAADTEAPTDTNIGLVQFTAIGMI